MSEKYRYQVFLRVFINFELVFHLKRTVSIYENILKKANPVITYNLQNNLISI